ncbi:MAG TPA: bifunctional DNA-formamidopyrimidine glycosylase/DNA-(apurinic or apyrimidinic site) lyase [Caulobacteraceae bacterium]
MPELPEVETVRRGLEPALARQRLSKVEIRRPDLRFAFPTNFVRRLTGFRVEAVRRRGKFLLAPLDSGETLIMHLGMSGRFAIGGSARCRDTGRSPPRADPKHTHVVFETEAGARVIFVDARRFGFMELGETASIDTHPRLAGLGPEPFDERFAGAYLAAEFVNRRVGVKALLMNQAVVAGLGNIYASEALHRARIAPARPANTIGREGLDQIPQAVRSVLKEAIASGGSTLRDYAAADGSPGYFQHRFTVYGRGGQSCSSPGCGGTIRRSVQAGRATFHCPSCQK